VSAVAPTVDAPALARLDALAAQRGMALSVDALLAPLTTLRVGGPADRLATATTTDELVGLLTLAGDAGVPAFVLGKGSDLVVADAGIRGLVIRVRADGVAIDGTAVTAEAGASMTGLAKSCARAGLAGFDWAISIPGSFGGAVWANAGAHGGEMAQVLRGIDTWDPASRQRRTIRAEDAGFAYRDSRFKRGDEVVLGGIIDLVPGDAADVQARLDAHQARRRATQPLADQNAGSVFRNPPDDHAGRLIEAAGLKGHRVGTAQVSTLHANFIVTDRGAGRAADVKALGDTVRTIVADRFGVDLRYEIEFVGDWPEEGS
jgi:UDP-N-acetylmuramate dehydrogenase